MSKIGECDYLLDSILNLIHKVSDDDPAKEALFDKYFSLRQRFENYDNDDNLIYILVKYLSSLEMYVNGQTLDAPVEEISEPPQIKGYEHHPIKRTSNINQYIDILFNTLDDAMTSNDFGKLQNLTSHVQDEYTKISLKRQSLDQKISEAWFKLMIFYLTNNQIENATELSKNFGLDMRIYLIEYFKGVILDLKESNNKEAEYAWKYLYSKNPPKENDLKLWEHIVNIEYPDKHFVIPSEYLTKDLVISEEKQLGWFKWIFTRKNSSTKLGDKANNTKVCVIRSNFGDPVLRDLFYLRSCCKMDPIRPNRYVTAVFEEGVERIRLYDRRLSGAYNQDYSLLKKIVIPSTARIIENSCFSYLNSINELDLANTNITELQDCAFKYARISSIIFPSSLSKIGNSCFFGTTLLKKVDLSQTQVEVLENGAFWDSSVEEIKFPKTLVVIKDGALGDTKNLKTLDLRDCQNLTYISLDAIRGSGITTIILPKRGRYLAFLRANTRIKFLYKDELQ